MKTALISLTSSVIVLVLAVVTGLPERTKWVVLAPTANLVAHPDLHPAIIDLMLQAASDVHREGDRYMSWNWGQGKDTRLAGREPARRAIEAHLRDNA